jgi:general secretion pathway protein J
MNEMRASKVWSSGFSPCDSRRGGAPLNFHAALQRRMVCGLKPGLRTSAFTLIEVMIALAVFAIVMAAINGIFWGALRLRNKTVASIDATLQPSRALGIIRNDLENIVPPGGKFFTTFTTTVPSTNSAVGTLMSMMPGQNSPEFTTSNALIDDSSNWGDIQRVSYQVANSTNGGYGQVLYRNVTRNLLPSLAMAGEQQVILTGVQSIYFYYHDGQQWKQTWDSTNEVYRLPRALKVEIQMASEERGRQAPPPYEMIVPLIDAGTNTTQVATQ